MRSLIKLMMTCYMHPLFSQFVRLFTAGISGFVQNVWPHRDKPTRRNESVVKIADSNSGIVQYAFQPSPYVAYGFEFYMWKGGMRCNDKSLCHQAMFLNSTLVNSTVRIIHTLRSTRFTGLKISNRNNSKR